MQGELSIAVGAASSREDTYIKMTNDADKHIIDGTSPTINYSEVQSSSSDEDIAESPTRRISLSDAKIVLTYVRGMMMKQKEIGNDVVSKFAADASVSLLKTRESLQKLQEYERYIEHCDNNEDWSLPVVDKIPPRIPWSPPLPPSKPPPLSQTRGHLSKSIRISNMNDVSDIQSPIVILDKRVVGVTTNSRQKENCLRK